MEKEVGFQVDPDHLTVSKLGLTHFKLLQILIKALILVYEVEPNNSVVSFDKDQNKNCL